MSSQVNETLIRDVVAEVLEPAGTADHARRIRRPAARPRTADCGCNGNGHASSASAAAFAENSASFRTPTKRAQRRTKAFVQLQEKGVAAGARSIEIVKTMAEANAEEWGRIELEETKIGRLDHKIEKLKIIKLVPGVEWLRPMARSGDHGITLEEYTPFGVVGAITPRRIPFRR